ncbi:hypothetical protein ABZP36_033428 [Zizania latifolia]
MCNQLPVSSVRSQCPSHARSALREFRPAQRNRRHPRRHAGTLPSSLPPLGWLSPLSPQPPARACLLSPSCVAGVATAPSHAALTFGKRSDGCSSRRSSMGMMLYGSPDTATTDIFLIYSFAASDRTPRLPKPPTHLMRNHGEQSAAIVRRFSSEVPVLEQMNLIIQLRERTSVPIKDVKASLKDLRKRGVVLAAKKSLRTAAEGLLAIAQDEKMAAVVELNCETDFVARNDVFQYLQLDHNSDSDSEEDMVEGLLTISDTKENYKIPSQADLIRQAFAGDDVEAEFEKDKMEILNEENPEPEKPALIPGWGQWTDIQQKKGLPSWMVKEHENAKRKREEALKRRKDVKLKHVIISEHVDKKAEKLYQVICLFFTLRRMYMSRVSVCLLDLISTQHISFCS